MSKSPLVTKQEAAEYLRVNMKTVERMVARGTLKKVDLGGRAVRFNRSDLENLAKKKMKYQKRAS